MKNTFLSLAILAGVTLIGVPAMAGERLNDGLLGAGAGAIVGGPVGAVAGGAIGYTAGPNISHGMRHHGHRHYRHRHYHH